MATAELHVIRKQSQRLSAAEEIARIERILMEEYGVTEAVLDALEMAL